MLANTAAARGGGGGGDRICISPGPGSADLGDEVVARTKWPPPQHPHVVGTHQTRWIPKSYPHTGREGAPASVSFLSLDTCLLAPSLAQMCVRLSSLQNLAVEILGPVLWLMLSPSQSLGMQSPGFWVLIQQAGPGRSPMQASAQWCVPHAGCTARSGDGPVKAPSTHHMSWSLLRGIRKSLAQGGGLFPSSNSFSLI